MSSPADRTGGGSSRLGRSKNDERIKRVRILATVPVIILAGVLSGRGSDWTTWRADSARSGYTKDALPEKLALSWSWTPRHAPRSAWPRDDRMKFDRVNIAFAVALDDGLVVPVIRETNSKNIREIAGEVKTLSEAAKNGTLGPDDFMGGTFTISILGSVDGFTPILNQSQVGLLGVGRSLQKPVVKDGQVVIREMMTLSLTGDHQVVDGAVAASFFRRLQRLIESPSKLFA